MRLDEAVGHSYSAGVDIAAGAFLASFDNIEWVGALVDDALDRCLEGSHRLMSTVAVKVEDIDAEGSVYVPVAQIHHGDSGHRPNGTQIVLDSRTLPYFGPLAILRHSIDTHIFKQIEVEGNKCIIVMKANNSTVGYILSNLEMLKKGSDFPKKPSLLINL